MRPRISFPPSVRPRICVILGPNAGIINPLCVRLWPESPTNYDLHLTESIFQTRSGVPSGRLSDYNMQPGQFDPCVLRLALSSLRLIIHTQTCWWKLSKSGSDFLGAYICGLSQTSPRGSAYFDHPLIRQGIYKIIVPQYPAVSQVLPFMPSLDG